MSTMSEHPTGMVCSRHVLAASAPSQPIAPVGTPFVDLGQPGSSRRMTKTAKSGRESRAAAPPMLLTERDREIIELVFRARAMRADQIQTALFTPGGSSRCQRRLTLLVRNRYLDHLPRTAVNAPAVYVLGQHSTAGNRLLRERYGDQEYRRQMRPLGAIDHLLAINDVRVRVERACLDLGWSLRQWRRSDELARLMHPIQLVPDGYFQIQRQLDGRDRTAAFFLEVERAAKSSAVLRSKLRRYGELYYSGRYEQMFGTKALRLLVVFDALDERSNMRLIESGAAEAQRQGVTFTRFATLTQIKAAQPADVLLGSLWSIPDQSGAASLFTN
ncbi:MAG: hypothetical protein EPO21_01500 [Chloroflexota bacterium]|nr:MAG: hypothetical protein EPO21_01500 [Chloroflexota bacterium]